MSHGWATFRRGSKNKSALQSNAATSPSNHELFLQRLQKRIKQHIPKFTISTSRKSLPRRCKANNSPRQFHESAIGQHLPDNPVCTSHYNDDKFSILARGRSLFHLSALEDTFIKSLKPILRKQKDFVYSLKLS